MKDGGIARRDFIFRGSVAAAGIASFGRLAEAAGETVTAGDPASTRPAAAPPPALPPPLSAEVFLSRQEDARARLRAAQASALIETTGANLRYLTGVALRRRARLAAFVLPAEGPPMLICSALDRHRVESAPSPPADVSYWEEDQDPFALIRKILRKRDLDKGVVAMGSRVGYDEFAHISADLPKLTFVSTTPVVGFLRERKSAGEIEILEAAAAVAERAVSLALPRIATGLTDHDLEAMILAHVRETGADGDVTVLSGPRSAAPGGWGATRPIAGGDVVLIEVVAEIHGYHARLTRPAVLGKASGRMKMIHSLLRKGQDLALERLQPDTVCSSVDQIARAAVGGPGFLKEYLHRLGGGIGLDPSEPPWLSPAYHEKLAPGNTVVMEPGVYTAGEYGLRVGDMAVVTAAGSRWISRPPEDLPEI